MDRDRHSGPVSERAWHADALARERGRVEIFNATRPDGLDGWTMDLAQYELMRAHILDMIDEEAAADGSITLRDVVHAAQERYATHPLFPGGRTRNYCTFTKVDLGGHDPPAGAVVAQAVLDPVELHLRQALPAALRAGGVAEHDGGADRSPVTVDGAVVPGGLGPGRPLHEPVLVGDGLLHLRQWPFDDDAARPLHRLTSVGSIGER